MFDLLKRINRKTYWLGLLIFYLGVACWLTILILLPLKGDGSFEPIYDIPLSIALVFLFWFGVCITRQRANDISGDHPLLWTFLSIFILCPIIGAIPGEKRPNKYGPSSKTVNLFARADNQLPRLSKFEKLEHVNIYIANAIFLLLIALFILAALVKF